VTPVGRAYRTSEISPPYTAEFDFVEGTVDCPYGVIGIVFRREGGNVKLKLEVPFGTTATLGLPGGEKIANIAREGSVKRSTSCESVDLEHGKYTVYFN
jgi:hypothetical protein